MWVWDYINGALAILVGVGAVVFVLGGLVFRLNGKPTSRR
jgi:hypothetical protein